MSQLKQLNKSRMSPEALCWLKLFTKNNNTSYTNPQKSLHWSLRDSDEISIVDMRKGFFVFCSNYVIFL